MDYDLATRLTGRLFGDILYRNADREGFAHYLDALSTERLSLDDVIHELYTCDEFVRKFVLNQTPNELARNLVCTFFNTSDPSVRSMELISCVLDELVHKGLDSTVRSLIQDPRFRDCYGSFAVPRYVTKHDFTF
jgi:hypothetical protein